jgi:hypothetical protein
MGSEPPKADPQKRRRRWFQFSRRSLALTCAVLLIVAVNALRRELINHTQNASALVHLG